MAGDGSDKWTSHDTAMFVVESSKFLAWLA